MDKLNDQDRQLIDRHLKKELSPTEQVTFDQKMKEADFQKEVEQQEQFMAAIEDLGNREIKTLLQKEETKLRLENKESNVFAKKKIAWRIGKSLVAIAASVLLFLFIFQNKEEESYTSEMLYAANFTVYPNELYPLERGSTEESLSPQQSAFLNYEQGNFDAAIATLDSLISISPNDDLLFYQALAQMATDRNTDAIINLTKVVDNEQSDFGPQAQWYLALIYIKIGAEESARPLLQELAAQAGGFKSSRSQAVLELMGE